MPRLETVFRIQLVTQSHNSLPISVKKAVEMYCDLREWKLARELALTTVRIVQEKLHNHWII
jgi:hypothetical protein